MSIPVKESLSIEYITVETKSPESMTEEIVRQTVFYITTGERVFVIARDNKHQNVLKDLFTKQGLKPVCFKAFTGDFDNGDFDNGDFDEGWPFNPNLIITTQHRCEGYTLNDVCIGITGMYNDKMTPYVENLKRQHVDRIFRVTSIRPIKWITIKY